MAMHGLGLPELILLLFLGRGTSPELLSLIDAGDYFAARHIKAETVEQLVSLAANGAKEPRETVVRLLAIRTLGERKAAGARAALAKIAAEPAGFAKDYAERALAAIDGKDARHAAMPKGSLSDALAWFPADTDFFGGLDRRGVPGGLGGDDKTLTALRKELPDDMKEGIYKFAEAVGNVRVDRVSFAFGEEPRDAGGRIMIRLTGLCDRQALSAFVASTCRNPNIQEDKAAGTTLISHDRAPHFLFVGDTDLIMAGTNRGSGDSAAVMQQVVETRAGKRPAAVKGAFSKDLKAVAPDVFGVLFGALTENMRKDMARPPLGVAPLNVALEIAPADKGLRLRAKAEMEDAEQAGRFIEAAKGLRAMGLEGLKQAPADVPAEMKAGLTKILEGLTFKAADKFATIEVTVPEDALRSIPETLLLYVAGGRSAPAAPPVRTAVPKGE